jgi:hypothetical protein
MEGKKEIIISIKTNVESDDIMNGNCLQISFVAFFVDTIPTDDESWIVDSLDLCFTDQNKKKDPKLVEFWNVKHPEIKRKIDDNSRNIKDQMLLLQYWLNFLSTRYIIELFVADTSYVSFSWFTSLYSTHCNTKLDNFDISFSCLSITDMTLTLLLLGITNQQIQSITKSSYFKKTYYAMDDAKLTAYEFLSIRRFLSSRTI